MIEDLEFWRAFLRQLLSRGLRGVRLVTSDSHLGLKQAVAEVLVGATWQRCRVHFVRNALATVPKVAQQIVAATLRTIFAQPDLASARDALERIARLFEKRYPKLVEVLREAETDILAYYGFPIEHRRQIWSTNSLERLKKEVSRRCDVVGIFPSRQSLLRLAGALLEEQNDEWAVGRRYFSAESKNKLYEPSHEEVVQALLELQSAWCFHRNRAVGFTPPRATRPTEASPLNEVTASRANTGPGVDQRPCSNCCQLPAARGAPGLDR